MADGEIRAKVRKFLGRILNVHGAVGLVGLIAFIIGIFVVSAAARILCALILLTAVAYFVVPWWNLRRRTESEEDHPVEDHHPQTDASHMKKLLFDDFQPTSSGTYVVKQIDDDEKVVPSTKTAQPVVLREETVREFDILDFFDLDSDEPYTETEPKSEFHSLLNKVLLVLKDVLFAHTVSFFWANREKQQMVLESMATDSKNFMSGKRFPMEGDLVSQIAQAAKPQVIGRVTPASEKELIRYYESTEGVRSILGVPVFFRDSGKDILPVGVIVADSKVEDAFGYETLALLGRFTKLVSGLIKSYTDKYDLLLDSELLASLRRMQDRLKSDPSEVTVLNALGDEANRLANWDCLTVTMYDDSRHGWVLQKVVNKGGQPYVVPDDLVDMNASIVGNVIRLNDLSLIEDLASQGGVRFHESEHHPLGGSFLGIPITSFNRCYGALTLESRNPRNFSGSEVETLYRLVEHAASALEVIYMNDMIKDYVVVDHLTGSLTRKYFMKKLEEEVQRAEDFGAELAFVSVAIDGEHELADRYGKDGADTVLTEVARILRSNMRQYDVLGRQEGGKLGVLLINTAASEAYLWAEKMRKAVASHVIPIGSKSLSVTISAGVCGLAEGMQAGELIGGTSQVLGKAMENGGNLVRVY